MQGTKLLGGKTVVIIGGAGLIGQAFSRGIVSHGGKVIVADIDIARCHDVCNRIADEMGGIRPEAEVVDITSKISLDSLIDRISAVHSSIDAVVNNAYPRNERYGRKLEDVDYEDFCENISLHLGGYFLSTQRFADHFKTQGYGQVINISSIYGVIPPRFEIYEGTNITMPVEYAAIKSAIQHLSLYFMRYYKGSAVRFNCISPGGIWDNQPKIFVDAYKKFSQSKGLLVPEDLIGTLIYLVSDLSSAINGQNIVVDDGWTA